MTTYEKELEERRQREEAIGFRYYKEVIHYPGCFGRLKDKTEITLQYFDKTLKEWKAVPTKYKSTWID